MRKYPEAMVLDDMEHAFDESGAYCGKTETGKMVIWNRYHETVKAWLESGLEPGEIWSRTYGWMRAFEECVIISDEIGNGIVPMDKEQRYWREETGRLLCRITGEAGGVQRICCGLPIRIK